MVGRWLMIVKQIDKAGQIDRQMDRKTDRQTDTDEQTDRHVGGRQMTENR